MAPHRESGLVFPENILFFVFDDSWLLLLLIPIIITEMISNLRYIYRAFLNTHYVYNLHQKNGFTCMLLGEIFELVYVWRSTVFKVIVCLSEKVCLVLYVLSNYVISLALLFSSAFTSLFCFLLSPWSQLLFVVGFTVFLANCVDYDILFANKFVNHTDSSKVTLPDAFLPVDVCSARWVWLLCIFSGHCLGHGCCTITCIFKL